MRFFIALLSIALLHHAEAQVYMRKKQNIGFYTGGTFKDAQFNTASIGLTRSVFNYFEPEIGLRATLPLAAPADNSQMHNVYLTAGLNVRKSLFPINQRKKGRSCRGEIIEIFAAPEYNYLIKSNTDRFDQGQFSLRTGLGIFHYQTGFSKRSKAWNMKVQFYYRYVPGPITNTMSIKNEFGIQLRIFKFKTY
ncbi:MAG: hypothetical protein ACKO5L_04625, partial [Bacteroidota bacterium]